MSWDVPMEPPPTQWQHQQLLAMLQPQLLLQLLQLLHQLQCQLTVLNITQPELLSNTQWSMPPHQPQLHTPLSSKPRE